MIISYNGVTLPYAATSRFDKTAVPDPSNTDLTLMQYAIEVVVTLNYRYMAAVIGDGDDADGMQFQNAAACQVRIHDLLMERRKRLSVKFNNFEYIPDTGSARSPVDALNGPVPQYCRMIDMGNETFILQYGIVAHYYDIVGVDPESLETLPGRSPVVYNRWKETVDIDEIGASVKTREGSFRIRSDPRSPITPDELRGDMAVLSIPDGFLRKSSKFSVSEDGLTLTYSITDQEYWKLPPTPAYVADGYYRETALGPAGAVKHAQCRTFLRGTNYNDQTLLLEKALSVCLSKLALVGAPLKKGGSNAAILISAVMEVKHYRNEVDVVITAMIPVGNKRFGKVPDPKMRLAGLTQLMTQVPFSESLPGVPGGDPPAPPQRTYGEASLLLTAASYFDPAAGNAALKQGPQFVEIVIGGFGGKNPTIPYGGQKVVNNGTVPGKG